jgi:vacuolar-type H+-ATPase subunit D/Vma8
MANENLDEDGRPIPVYTPPQIQKVDLRAQPIEETRMELEKLWDEIRMLKEAVERLKQRVNGLSAT